MTPTGSYNGEAEGFSDVKITRVMGGGGHVATLITDWCAVC